MKHLVLVTLAFICSASAEAGITMPYRKVSIDCDGNEQTIQMQWNSSKSPHLYRLLVNGKDEANGMSRFVDSESTSYEKPNVFAVTIYHDDKKAQFAKTVTIGNESMLMICHQSASWHVLESD